MTVFHFLLLLLQVRFYLLFEQLTWWAIHLPSNCPASNCSQSISVNPVPPLCKNSRQNYDQYMIHPTSLTELHPLLPLLLGTENVLLHKSYSDSCSFPTSISVSVLKTIHLPEPSDCLHACQSFGSWPGTDSDPTCLSILWVQKTSWPCAFTLSHYSMLTDVSLYIYTYF